MAWLNTKNFRSLVLLIYLNIASVVFTLSVFDEKPNSHVINFEEFGTDLSQFPHHTRIRRDVNRDDVDIKVNKLNDTHQQLIVHWVGEESNVNTNVIICLARNPKESTRSAPSAVYYSYNYGDSYVNKTEYFKINDKLYAQLDKYYIHPRYISHTIFVDSTNKVLFITEDHGLTFRTVKLEFTPNDILFNPSSSRTFMAYDKTNSSKILWITEDFGRTWSPFQLYIKAYDWFPMNNTDGKSLILQREEPDGSTMLLRVVSQFAMNFDKYTLKGLLSGVLDFHAKGNFMFATKNESKSLELYIKYKNSKFMRAKFEGNLTAKDYHVADVSENRVFIVVGHTETLCNLYVSELVNEDAKEVRFSLSLDRIFAYFPNITWKGSLISGMSDVTFIDLHKVEGMRGIYIASQIIPSVNSSSISPEDLMTRITFDWGVNWRPLNLTKQLTGELCLSSKNCSLHLTQKFAFWYPSHRYTPILSSQSAPGIIIATGTVGKTMAGQASVYMSRDAGVTWKQVLSDNYYFNFGDHGGIIVAVKFFKVKEDVNSILYSTDEGETWRTHKMNTPPMKIYSLMTEPGENTTVFSLFGSSPGIHQWIIIKADFRNVFAYNCTATDYKEWAPKHPDETKLNCLLGKRVIYSRRISNANCYNGKHYIRPVKTETCPCDKTDYECDFAFYWNTTTDHCVRNKSIPIDPYAVPRICPPYSYYNRTKGYRKIPSDECEGGSSSFFEPNSIPCPVTEKKDMILLAQKDKIVTFSLKNPPQLQQLPITGLQNVIAVEYDFANDCVFYADIVTDVIAKWCLTSGLLPQNLVEAQIQSVEGMAFDWVSKHLYFVDGVLAKIEVIRTDINSGSRFRKTVVNNTVAKKPRGIAVHPVAGYMFWTDWASGAPSINRANLDGTDVKKLFTSPIVEWPNGITIDFISERIYWVDAKEDYIASSDLEGGAFKKIIERSDKVAHPFSVAVFKDNMYWDDWKQNSIFVADKESGLGVGLVLDQLAGLMDMKVFAHAVQEGSNKCTNNTVCSHLCFGLPNNKFSCQCPDELILVNSSRCVCPGGQEPVNKDVCMPVDNTCGPNLFKCNNSKCIPSVLKCDGDDDCGDRSDEICDNVTTCAPNMFRCAGNGKCIPLYWKCDNDYDCADRSDEKDCTYGPCKDDHFTCDNSRCIPRKWRCDGEDDCHDGSDERNCTTPHVSCSADEFACNGSELSCIPTTWKCDNERDCADGSDEAHCNTTCDPWKFTCKNNKCILKSWKCDGENDCGDFSDEQNCTNIVPPSPFNPPTDSPTERECRSWMFECNNKKCVPYWWKCDGVNDCMDGSDELGCGLANSTKPTPTLKPTTPAACEGNQFKCSSGECIHDAWICDGIKDCEGGEDERDCNHTITRCKSDHSEFRCRQSGMCIPKGFVCDGINHCPDGSDEGLCNSTGPIVPALPCNYGNFTCDGGRCLPLYMRCDNASQCYDKSDEERCGLANKSYQIVDLEVYKATERSIYVSWGVKPSYSSGLLYLPSIRINGTWRNETWISRRDYEFDKLISFNTYTVTVYVQNDFLKKEYPPAFYYNVTTQEGEPSPPTHVVVVQKNISLIQVQWSPPARPNGELQSYTIFVSPPIPPVSLSVNALRRNATLHYEFEAKKEYTVTVTANNHMYESNHSAPFKFRYDDVEMVNGVSNLKVDKKTEYTVTLSWAKNNANNTYLITPRVKPPYPIIRPILVQEVPYTVTNLSSGVEYVFEVSALRDDMLGNPSTIVVQTEGQQLPTVNNVKATSAQNVVKLSWDAPKDKRKSAWMYGIYYGVTMQEVFQEPKNTTSYLNFNVYGLTPCTAYTFGVGVISHSSYGPLSNKFATVLTPPDPEAVPLNLNVQSDPSNETNLIVSWTSSCPKMIKPVGYTLLIEEVKTHLKTQIPIQETKNTTLKVPYAGTYGAKYKFTLSTNEETHVSAVTEYQIAPCPPPHQVIVYQHNNGYAVTWDVKSGSSTLSSKKYKFEVLVNEGNHIDRQRAKTYSVEKPPAFIENLKNGLTYTFAVRIVSNRGDYSELSEEYTVENKSFESVEQRIEEDGGTSYTWLILLLLVMVGGGVAYAYWKNKRSHINFKNLANSHYNTRSGSTTFTGVNGLDLEDSPEIREHFSDDEPLVIA